MILYFKKQGLESKKLEEIYLAETMLQSVEIIRKEEDEERKEGSEILKALEKRKTSLIDNCFLNYQTIDFFNVQVKINVSIFGHYLVTSLKIFVTFFTSFAALMRAEPYMYVKFIEFQIQNTLLT